MIIIKLRWSGVNVRLDFYYLRACLQEVTSSSRLFKLAGSALQIMKYFSHRHKLQRFEAGLNGAACFKIFQVKLNPIFQVPDVLTEFRIDDHMYICLESSQRTGIGQSCHSILLVIVYE